MEDSGKTVQLMTIKDEKDLGIYIVDNLKPSIQCTTSSEKAMSVMRLIKRNIKSIDIEEFNLLFKAYIRPHLEYCIQVWSPYLRKDIECLERVQRRATKLVGSLNKKAQLSLTNPRDAKACRNCFNSACLQRCR